MAERIKVSTEEMQSTLNTFNTQQAAQSSAYQNMKSTITALTGNWQGAAADAFQQQFELLYQNISQSETKMQDAVDELAKAAELFNTAENDQVRTSANALDVGKSPFA